MEMLFKNKLKIAGITIGAIVGYSYYYFVGCADGSCAITANPVYSTLYGSVLGSLIITMFKRENKNQTVKQVVIKEDKLNVN